MLRRKVTLCVVAAGLAVGLASVTGASSASAGVPALKSPAVFDSVAPVDTNAEIQLAGHWHGYGGYGYGGYGGGYGWGGGYRGGYYGGPVGNIGLYAPVYRRYPGFGTPVYTTPVYAAPVYGYPGGLYPSVGYGYPAYGYGCW